jgi:hypothetical protein
MKSARVSVIKDNITKGTIIPKALNDCTIGQWADQEMVSKGHRIDKHGTVDMPEYGIDNKTRKKGSKANHTIGSWLKEKIKNTPIWEDTPFYEKSKNQNQIEWDPYFMEISKVKVVDMEIDLIQEKLKEGYEDCQTQMTSGNNSKEIKSKNGWVVFDGYNDKKSYRMRITDKAMKQIYNISGSRDTFKAHFEEIKQ